MRIVIDESKIMEVSVLIERARVISNTLVEGCFDQTVESPKSLWKLSGSYYDNARVIAETVLSFVNNAEQLLDEAVTESTKYTAKAEMKKDNVA